jgi:GTPase SAR1 family protein
LKLEGCSALHTPPPHVVWQDTAAVLEFLRDLAKGGDAPCHLIKVVLLGNQRAGKSSLADSLVLGRPVTRADSDRTVGIEVRRWPVGRKSQLVVNIYDAAGQRVYRATHGLFMSAGALFLHVVRSDMLEDEAVETLLE